MTDICTNCLAENEGAVCGRCDGREELQGEIASLKSKLDDAERRGAIAGRLNEVRELLKCARLMSRDLELALQLRVAQLEAQLKAAEAK